MASSSSAALATFEEAEAYVRSLPKLNQNSGSARAREPSSSERLRLYALYKQATAGPCTTPRPGGWLDFEGKAKWDAWFGVKSMSPMDAQRLYLSTVNALRESSL